MNGPQEFPIALNFSLLDDNRWALISGQMLITGSIVLTQFYFLDCYCHIQRETHTAKYASHILPTSKIMALANARFPEMFMQKTNK